MPEDDIYIENDYFEQTLTGVDNRLHKCLIIQCCNKYTGFTVINASEVCQISKTIIFIPM